MSSYKRYNIKNFLCLGIFTISFIILFSLLASSLEDSENEGMKIVNISINDFSKRIHLVPDNTKKVKCVALVDSIKNIEDIKEVKSYFYNKEKSRDNDSDDKNHHYSNNSCSINDSFNEWKGYINYGGKVLVECDFNVEYYANPGDWECYFSIKNNDLIFSNRTKVEILELLAIDFHESINYGKLVVREVSKEKEMLVENVGNVEIDLGIFGYAEKYRDGFAMNCTKGESKSIPLEYERYSVGESHKGTLNFYDFINLYKPISKTQKRERIHLEPRKNDTVSEAFESVYWRVYIPEGTAGECKGNLGIIGMNS